MSIFDGIEKLINEHGSAKILGERLLLAKDQNTAQEKRIAELERQLAESETEKTTLRLQFDRCQAEHQKTTQRLQDLLNLPTLNFVAPFYYAHGDSTPFCPTCWEVRKQAVHFPPPIRSGVGPSFTCPECKTNIVHPRSALDRNKWLNA